MIKYITKNNEIKIEQIDLIEVSSDSYKGVINGKTVSRITTGVEFFDSFREAIYHLVDIRKKEIKKVKVKLECLRDEVMKLENNLDMYRKG